MKTKILFIALFSFLLFSCVSSKLTILEDSYSAMQYDNNIVFLNPEGCENPQIITTDNIDNSYLEICAKHYCPIGNNAFYGIKFNDYEYLKDFAKKIKADIILLEEKYRKTDSYNSGYIGAYGGSLSTRNYDIFDYNVYYFRKFDASGLIGFSYDNLNEMQRTENKTNTAVIVTLVLEDTPAFYANLIRDDIIITMNDSPVINAKNFSEMLQSRKSVNTFTILRDGKKLEISIKE